MALPKAALQTQGRRNVGRRNEGRRNEACRNKACQSKGCQSGADQNQGCQDRTQLTIDQDGNSDANVVKPVALGMKLVDAKTIHPAIKYAFASTGSNNLLSYNNGDGGSKLLNQCRRLKSFAYS